MYPSNLHMFAAPGPGDPLHRSGYVAGGMRHRADGHRAVSAYPALRDRLRAGVRVVTTRRVVAPAR